MDWAVPYRCACGNTRRFQEILWEQEEEIARDTARWAWIVGLWCDRCGAVLYEAPEVSILRLQDHTRSMNQMDQIYYDRYRRLPEKPYAFLPEEPLELALSDRPSRITLREVDQHSTIWHWLVRRVGEWWNGPSKKDPNASSRPACHEVFPPK